MIEFKNTQIGYQQPLLFIDELNLNSGEIHVLIGANGKGKTTLLKSINGLQALVSGQIEIDHRLTSALNHKDLSNLVAFVSSKFDGIEHLKVYDYIALGRTPYTNLFGRLSSEDHIQIQHAINTLGIDYLSDKLTTEISDGERQLCSIARALAQETPIITLDEPTAFLDYANRVKVLSILKSLATNQHKCIVLSSHDIDICLEMNLPILYIDSSSNHLIKTNTASKSLLLQHCFGM
ncbi:MAG: ABC transporter ATP-binding protein [Crocinitomicaceae bacterium]|nr:ABC transporter ATP-binding protein [Crocinitomicaceae bacterium]MDP4865416.1 ABC transporter ATP-binding protein [Crocinitomicaceae bacterium]MDP5009744.1 ABC transporter ATP-binding protein [Crocinitomicaceae bacterium]